MAGAVALGVHDEVAAGLARPHHDARGEVLDGVEHVALLADDAARVGALDLDADFVGRALAVVRREVHLDVHLHLAAKHPNEGQRLQRLRRQRGLVDARRVWLSSSDTSLSLS